MNKELHFSSKSDDWATPQDLFDKLNIQYGPFDLDVCASPFNAKCLNYCTVGGYQVFGYPLVVGINGLQLAWKQSGNLKCWMNPPYGREISKWVKKAYEESLKGCLVVCLLPSRTDTKWFHEYCTKGKIEFIKGRLKFGDAKNSAPFPSMIVVFGQK